MKMMKTKPMGGFTKCQVPMPANRMGMMSKGMGTPSMNVKGLGASNKMS